jgi:hypothetical protein
VGFANRLSRSGCDADTNDRSDGKAEIMVKWYAKSRWLLVATALISLTGCASTSRTVAKWVGREKAESAIAEHGDKIEDIKVAAKAASKSEKKAAPAEESRAKTSDANAKIAKADAAKSGTAKPAAAKPDAAKSDIAKSDAAGSARTANTPRHPDFAKPQSSASEESAVKVARAERPASPNDTAATTSKDSEIRTASLPSGDDAKSQIPAENSHFAELLIGKSAARPTEKQAAITKSAALPDWAQPEIAAETAQTGIPEGPANGAVQGVSHTAPQPKLPDWALGNSTPEKDSKPAATTTFPPAKPEDPKPEATGMLAICPEATGTTAELVASLDTSDVETLKRNIQNLGRLGDSAKPSLPALRKLLEHPNQIVSVHAALAVIRVDGTTPDAMKCLIGAMKASDPAVRSFAAAVIAGLGPEGQAALPAVAASLHDQDGYVRLHVSEVLIRFESWSQEALQTLLGCLRDRDANVRWLATYSVAELTPQTPEVVDALVRSLDDPVEKVRVGAAYALGELGPIAKPAEARLKILANDSSEEVSATAIQALRQIRQ